MEDASTAGNRPTPEYLQHGPIAPPCIDATEFRPYWRRRDRLEKLCADDVITPAELRAAHAFRANWEIAHRGDSHPMQWNGITLDRHCRGRRPEPSDRKLDALRWLRTRSAQLGALFVLLEMVAIEDLSWCAIGRRFGIDSRTARTWSCAAIAGLAAL
jgi:hypothetical protein